MKDFLADAFHIFIIFMMAIFIIGGILAVTGTFDHWGSRYILKRRRRRLMRNRRTEVRDTKPEVENTRPYYSTAPDKKTEGYKRNFSTN